MPLKIENSINQLAKYQKMSGNEDLIKSTVIFIEQYSSPSCLTSSLPFFQFIQVWNVYLRSFVSVPHTHLLISDFFTNDN
jgi:hypothetical protein